MLNILLDHFIQYLPIIKSKRFVGKKRNNFLFRRASDCHLIVKGSILFFTNENLLKKIKFPFEYYTIGRVVVTSCESTRKKKQTRNNFHLIFSVVILASYLLFLITK